MKRVLLTGATGFVGRHAIEPLLARGYEVHAVSSRGGPFPDARPTWHRADLLDEAGIAELAGHVRATHLLHLAWYTAHGRFWDSPLNHEWHRGSLALVRAFHAQGGRRAVLAGTCAEYGPCDEACSEADTPTTPASLYGTAKLALHDDFHAFRAAARLDGAWGRVFFMYGPGEHPDRLLPTVARALLEGRRAACTHGRQVRDFLHVADVASAFVALLDGSVQGDVNIASGVPLEVRELATAVAHALGAGDRVDFGAVPASPAEAPRIVADVRRLSREVGFAPRHDLASGVADAVAWWRRALVA